jgi:hypothetical protein
VSLPAPARSRAFRGAWLPLCLCLACSGAPGDGLREMDGVEERLGPILQQIEQALEKNDASGLRTQADELIRLRLSLEGLRVRTSSDGMRQALMEALDGCIDGAQAGATGAAGIDAAEALRDSLQRAWPRERDPEMTPAVKMLRDSSAELERCRACLSHAAEALARAHEERARIAGGR